jgi:alkylation response protein AidB-like acyl-CoA dehydrogenase
MGHYKSNLRDLEFNLFEVFGRQEVLGTGPYAELDPETARDVLAQVERLASNEFAASFADGDRTPPVFDPQTSSVRLPDAFKKSFQAFRDAQWWRLALPEELGGTPAPPSLRWAVAELILGSNPGVWFYSSGPDFAHTIWLLGTEEQRKVARCMAEGLWGSSMVLTEPDAGSDVGAGRTRAIRQPDGTWHLEGVKRFITSAEHDLADNIVHLVLARPDGAGPGTKGLSMFIVPKYHFDWDTGEIGERNGIYATNVEHKMGLKISTTCELALGQGDRPAVGWLVGEVHDGIAQMFNVIEFARMMVGTKAIATLSTGYLNALDFAKSRVQGADLTQLANKSAPRVTITHHPDIRRSLMRQKSYAEGLRALVLFTASIQDSVLMKRAAGEDAESDERLNDLLLPIVKGYGSEKSYEILGAESLQTLGGSGYLQDYPLEQYVRDAKIDTLYEGTTAIQAQDLFFRKIVRDRGQAARTLFGRMHEFVKNEAGNGALQIERELLGQAIDDTQGIIATMVRFLESSSQDATSVYKVGQNTTRLLFALGDVIVAWLLLWQAEVALTALATLSGDTGSSRDRSFYEGKVAAARFFARTVLPTVAPQRTIAEGTDNSLMELPEDAF